MLQATIGGGGCQTPGFVPHSVESAEAPLLQLQRRTDTHIPAADRPAFTVNMKEASERCRQWVGGLRMWGVKKRWMAIYW